MSDFMRSIPITPDMVSLWVPSGLKRARDLIRGNHGQCYGTHPNVPVLPNVINPSVGWHFDGTNDYIQLQSPIVGIDPFSVFAWVNLPEIPASVDEMIVANYNGAYKGFKFFIHTGGAVFFQVGRLSDTSTQWVASTGTLSPSTWRFVGGIYDGIKPIAVLDGELKEGTNFSPIEAETTYIRIGKACWEETFFDGYIALPFITNSAWSAAQVSNFYNATKGMFAPRG